MATKSKDPIKHVVVLMLENQSFDRMLGALSARYSGKVDGVDFNNLRANRDGEGEVYSQAETTTLRFELDPKHELENVLRQIGVEFEPPRESKVGRGIWLFEWVLALCNAAASYRHPKPAYRALGLRREYEGAFVLDFAMAYPESTGTDRQEIMGYYPLDFLPALHALATNFTVCDRWFASVPGPTWANRFFVHSGTSVGRVWMPEKREDVLRLRPYDHTTVYDRLNERGVSWRIYFGDIPQTLVLAHQVHRQNIVNYRPMHRFYEDAAGPAADFPEYCFIEPTYFGTKANDDHPPHNTMHAQCLIADVYNALRQNEDLWRETLFVVMYDEHGGFFDHVKPRSAVSPDWFGDEYDFKRLGVRVPVILASPWTDRRVDSTQFDHTSLVKYLTEKWQLGPLGKRVCAANSIRIALEGVPQPRLEVLPEITDSEDMRLARNEPEEPEANLNGHQLALLVVSRILSTLLDTHGLPAVLRAQSLRVDGQVPPPDPTAEVEDAKRAVALLIEQEARKAENAEQ